MLTFPDFNNSVCINVNISSSVSCRGNTSRAFKSSSINVNSKSTPSSPLPISLPEIVNTSSIAYPLPAVVIVTLVTSVSDVTTVAIASLPDPPETAISVNVPAVATTLPVLFEILPNKASVFVFK